MLFLFQNRFEAGRGLAEKLASLQIERPVIVAIARGGVAVGSEVARALKAEFEILVVHASREIRQPLHDYRPRTPLSILGRTVILVDDGLDTGSTALAGVHTLRQRGAKKIIVAAPICSRKAVQAIQAEVDEVIYLESLEAFGSVEAWYEHFNPITDEEVARLLNYAARATSPPTKTL